MDARELRLGNIVAVDNPVYWPQLKGILLKVTGVREEAPLNDKGGAVISLAHICQDDNTYSQLSEFVKPVPLTEEILLKCGFEQELLDPSNPDEGVYYNLRFSDEKYCDLSLISCDKNGFLEVGLFPYEEFFRYKFLHELQNIIHALTGKELEIKL